MGKVKEAYAELEDLCERLSEISVSLCDTMPLGDVLYGLGFDEARNGIRSDLENAMNRLRYDVIPHKYDNKVVDLSTKG